MQFNKAELRGPIVPPMIFLLSTYQFVNLHKDTRNSKLQIYSD